MLAEPDAGADLAESRPQVVGFERDGRAIPAARRIRATVEVANVNAGTAFPDGGRESPLYLAVVAAIEGRADGLEVARTLMYRNGVDVNAGSVDLKRERPTMTPLVAAVEAATQPGVVPTPAMSEIIETLYARDASSLTTPEEKHAAARIAMANGMTRSSGDKSEL